MKNLIFVLLILGVSACGKNSSPSTEVKSTQPNSPSTSCKDLFSVWTSDSDSEEWDLSELGNQVIVIDYSYTAGNGVVCGYPTTSDTLSAQIVPISKSTGFDYQLEMIASRAMSGTCKDYVPPDSEMGEYSFVGIKTSCNEISVCTTWGIETCKTFH